MENLRPFTTATTTLLLLKEKENYFLRIPQPGYYRKVIEEERVRQEDLKKLIVDIQEKERKRIAEELHDNTCQMLSAIKLFIDQWAHAKRPRKKTIKKCSSYLAGVVEDLRNMSHNLRAIWLDENDLHLAIRKFIEMMRTLKNVSFRVAMNDFREESLSQQTKLVIFRIVQEQVQNILKHANASRISLTLKTQDSHGILRIQDNGQGADMTGITQNSGAGLKNIRDRVESIGGKMKLATAPEKGFKLEVQFPLEKP